MNPVKEDEVVRTMNRREALAGLGSVGLGVLLAACGGESGESGVTAAAEVPTSTGATATVQPQTASDTALAELFDSASSCTLTREQTEGPYYFDVDSIRSDIREDREGTTLRLAVRVQEASACIAIPSAVVDIWHCDASGLYSGFESASTGGGGPTDEETYLRGAQVTNAEGIVEFLTIYPGWYSGRTVHIHAKVHLDASTVLTTQLYFDDAVTDRVYAGAPYAERGQRDTTNDTDGIAGGGSAPLLTLAEDGAGYLGLITVGVDRA